MAAQTARISVLTAGVHIAADYRYELSSCKPSSPLTQVLGRPAAGRIFFEPGHPLTTWTSAARTRSPWSSTGASSAGQQGNPHGRAGFRTPRHITSGVVPEACHIALQ